ncbi:ANTAR domain-containing protein [Bacillus sp. AGMB 02131]|uniref:ANTAR domain-containing protein n=1 Tax=Peribacillus faecalis TaxID=2772559 RepID=A0A927CUH1_9BACI|nr:ANTAR domain-containing protein [Peribacillus faecalis]MBD3108048.1 ANTAR domain-containing protein [Peribacillus faecalis]
MSRRLLVVDDELVSEWTGWLTTAGFDVVGHAWNGEQAIKLAYELRPDLILMKTELPKLNGLKASGIIYKAYRIPSLLICSADQAEQVGDVNKIHVLGYLANSLNEISLIPAVENALVQAKEKRVYEKKLKALNLSLQERKSVETAKGIIMRKRKVPEEKAYRLLRNLSSDKHLPIAKIAELIISKDDSAMMNK